MFVYLITNSVNGKRYVGQTSQTLTQRWKDHRTHGHCRYLHNAIQKYGKENFIVEPICEVSTRELANELEKEYIERYRTLAPNGYNLELGGDAKGSCLVGRKLSEETKRKLSNALKGRTIPEATRVAASLANLGRPLSDEHCQKISRALKGNKNGLGRVVSGDVRERLSKALSGRKFSEKWRQKLSQAKLGRKLSAETRQRMVIAQQARRLIESRG